MDKPEKIVTFRADTCTYRLVYPDFFLSVPKANLVKLFKWLFRYDLYSENAETIDFFDRELPELKGLVEARSKAKIEAAEKRWRDRLADYEKDYLDPNPAKFPATWDKGHKQAEKEQRKRHNAENLRRVKDAKADHERTKKQAQKDLERVKKVFAIYQEAKIR